ncbi:MAG: hypothetical protein H2172_13340 [Opitutus sp.]|nr:hypothetical protein [Opitutus sp.]MCS6275757.1 hypothetical protein [Opitutus sp.]MCS6300853.1 hypothetical protein [Opitutus sp.]
MTLTTLVASTAFAVQGFRLLFRASQGSGWSAASPALLGVICLIIAACLAAPRLVSVLTYPLNSLIGGFFYPQQRFTAPPDDLLLKLRIRISGREFESVEKQLTGLFAAYKPNPGLYHLRALLEVAQGRGVEPVTADAARNLSAQNFEAYQKLLRKFPARPVYPKNTP